MSPAPPSPDADVATSLRRHLQVCRELLTLVEAEAQSWRHAEPQAIYTGAHRRKDLLAHLNQSLDDLRKHRVRWQRLAPAERARQPEVVALLRLNQEIIMKIIVLDRENEQTLLRRGLVPVRNLPSAHRQRPHYVADLYRRGSAAAGAPGRPAGTTTG